MPMKILDANDPFFAPVWRRWATAVAPLAWAMLELVVFEAQGWAIVFGALGAYAFWVLIVKGPDQT